jgi:hypothetical protein
VFAQVDGFADGLGDHRSRHRVDGRAADLQAQAGLGDHADAFAAVELEAGLAAPADRRGQPRAVGDVGVVAGVLDHDGRRPGAVGRACVHGEADPLACGQADLDRLLYLSRAQGEGGGLGGGGGAGARGPAGAQRLLPDLGRAGQVGFAELGIGVHSPSRVVTSRSCSLAWRSALR